MRILYVEPFEGGSHASFTQTLTRGIEADWRVVTLPGRHWKWRMRGSAVYAALERADVLEAEHDLLLCSSFLPLAELVGLVPSLAGVPRILYFHENQLAYPDRAGKERDHHFGVTQMVSALCADVCVFNSAYNRDTFLEQADVLLRRMPDAVPRGWVERIASRARVLPVPLQLEDVPPRLEPLCDLDRQRGPVILWNHRWEHDKNPEAFFAALRELERAQVPFRVAVCGQSFRSVPAIFEQARQCLGSKIVHWGHLPSRAEYLRLLQTAHLVVSTAHHEFFGLSVLEAVHAGARPVVPDALAYPERIPEPFRYRPGQLVPALKRLCEDFVQGRDPLRADRRSITAPVLACNALPHYGSLFDELVC